MTDLAASTANTPWRHALALALAAAVSLGLARFAYALLLPAMREDLGWRYVTAGALNTANAVGYLLGALAVPWLLRRMAPQPLCVAACWAAALLLGVHGLVRDESGLAVLRLVLGVCSALAFVTGGLLSAQLAQRPGVRPALVLGLFYGGTGAGIVGSALLVPLALGPSASVQAWPWAWAVLGVAAGLASWVLGQGTRSMAARLPVGQTGAAPAPNAHAGWIQLGWALASYTLFGLGYIGYMTFIVTLLREQGASSLLVTVFYALLGASVMASSWVWAPLLQRFKGGQAMALLNALLAVATVLPVLSVHPAVILASGLLFGGVFLSVVASTTALVRHNLPTAQWVTGITAFTVVFAIGQTVGPSLTGWVADGRLGLLGGLALSAAVLALGAVLGLLQRPLNPAAPQPP
jgi:predicted MFS family arabinose efflux permease